MLRVDTVILDHWCQHARLEVDFEDADMIGVIGPNGVGKSNFCEGMRYGIAGESGNEGTKADDLMWGAESGYVRLGLHLNGIPCDLRRSITTASCKLKVGKNKSITKSTDVNEALWQMLGVDKRIIHDYVFVRQDKIHSVLFDEPAKRKEAMHKLFRLHQAEKIRMLLHKEMETIEVVSHKVRLDELDAELPNRETDVKTAEERLAEIAKHILPAGEDTERRKIVEAYNQARQAKGELQVLEQVIIDTHQKSELKKQEVAGARQELTTCQQSLQGLAPQLEAAQRIVNNVGLIQTKQAESKRATDELAQAQARLAALQVPAGDEAAMEQKVGEFSTTLVEAQSDIRTAQQFIEAMATGTCTACGQTVANPQDHIRMRQEQIAKLQPSIQAGQQNVANLQGQLKALRDARSAYQLEKTSLDTQIAQANRTLQECAASENINITEEQYRQATATVEGYRHATTAQTTATEKVTWLEQELNTLTAELTQKQTDKAAKEQQISTTVDEAAFQAATAELAAHDKHYQSYAEAKASLDLAQERTRQVLNEQKRLRDEESKGEQLRKFRTLLDSARAALHKDQLPALAARRFMRRIAENLGKFLEVFEAPFTVEIKDDLSFECTFTDGKIQSAARLSGGEKMMLGVCFRFAVNDLFASNLGLLVLDEPTASLDDDRVDQAVRLMKKVKEYTTRSGMQVVVVTHERRLIPAMDKVIRIVA